ncbi:MAG: hypothetical protein P8186_15625 [Anaerolineae bacterium]
MRPAKPMDAAHTFAEIGRATLSETDRAALLDYAQRLPAIASMDAND